MSKNLTRKGLAFGAAVALGSTLIAGSPAFAAAGINLSDLNAKGNYGMLAGETFTLSASANSDFNASNVGQLRVQIKNLDGVDATGFAIALGTGASAGITDLNDIDNLSTAGTTAADLTNTAGDTAVFGIGATSVATAGVGGASSMVSPFQFSFNAPAVTAKTTARYEVTVWADSDNDGAIDTDTTNGNTAELASSTRTVTFYNIADLATTVTIDDAIEGAATVGADVTITGVAVDQLDATEFGVRYTNGLDAAIGTGVVVDAVSLSTDKTKFESDLALTGTLAENTAVKAQLQFKDAGVTITTAANVAASANTNVGAAATKAVVALKAAAITNSVVTSTSANATNFKPDSTFSVKTVVEDDTHGATTADPVVGNKVTAKIEVLDNAGTGALTLSDTVYVVINGVKYTDKAKLPGTGSVAQLALTTDAKGEVALTIETKGLDGASAATGTTTDSVKVSFTTETLTVAVTELEALDAAYSIYALSSNGNIATTTDGVAVSVPVAVYDQYGGVPAAGYEVLTTLTSSVGFDSTGETASTSATEAKATLVDGKATLSITDNGTGTGINKYAVATKKLTGNTYSASIAGIAAFDVQIQDAATLVSGLVEFSGAVDATTYDATKKIWSVTAQDQPLALSTLGAFDARAVLGTNPAIADAKAVSVAGTIKTLASATTAAVLVDGTKVTFAGAGLQFKAVVDGKNVWATDSISVYTDGSGAFDVSVYSNKAGAQTLTATAGAATATLTVDFAPAAAASATALSIVAPASIVPGQFSTIKLLAADKYGNPVKTDLADGATADTTNSVKLSVAGGSGYWAVTPATETDADGYVSGVWITSAGDTGSIVVTAAYDHATLANDLSITKSITVGAVAVVAPKAAVIASKNGRVYVTVNSAAGFKSWVKVGFSTKPAFTTTGSKLVSYFVGADKRVAVRVYVRGGLVASQAITVK
jgi:hypothetical protein